MPTRKSNPRKEEGVGWALSEMAPRIKNSVPGKLFGFVLDSVGGGRASMSMQVRVRHKQVHGVVHGGILASLADTVGALAVYPMLPRGTRLATVEMAINYLEPVDRGRIKGEARVLRVGRNLAVVECDVYDAKGTRAAKALMTYAISAPSSKQRNPRR